MLEKARHEFINISDAKIHGVSMGEENDGTPFLLLHGFPDFYYGFRYLIPILSQDREVVAIDQRGYNESSKPENVEDYQLELLLKDVREVIEQKFSGEKVILVGHDWGGAISWHFARSCPDLIERLVILNCPPIDLLFKSFTKIPKQLLTSLYILTPPESDFSRFRIWS